MTAYTGTTLPSLLSGDIPPAADWQEITGALHGAIDAWTTYTPAWTTSGTAPAIGNGTLAGRYAQYGKGVDVNILWQAGSTTTFGTGTYLFSLPVTPRADQNLTALFNDSSGSLRWAGICWIILASTTGDNMRIILADGTANMTNIAPVTLATSDKLILHGHYEAA